MTGPSIRNRPQASRGGPIGQQPSPPVGPRGDDSIVVACFTGRGLDGKPPVSGTGVVRVRLPPA